MGIFNKTSRLFSTYWKTTELPIVSWIEIFLISFIIALATIGAVNLLFVAEYSVEIVALHPEFLETISMYKRLFWEEFVVMSLVGVILKISASRRNNG